MDEGEIKFYIGTPGGIRRGKSVWFKVGDRDYEITEEQYIRIRSVESDAYLVAEKPKDGSFLILPLIEKKGCRIARWRLWHSLSKEPKPKDIELDILKEDEKVVPHCLEKMVPGYIVIREGIIGKGNMVHHYHVDGKEI